MRFLLQIINILSSSKTVFYFQSLKTISPKINEVFRLVEWSSAIVLPSISFKIFTHISKRWASIIQRITSSLKLRKALQCLDWLWLSREINVWHGFRIRVIAIWFYKDIFGNSNLIWLSKMNYLAPWQLRKILSSFRNNSWLFSY